MDRVRKGEVDLRLAARSHCKVFMEFGKQKEKKNVTLFSVK
jgi:hypothetical protein